MKVVFKGTANQHDLVHVICSHCGTNVTFWRGEPDTGVDYIGCYNEGEKFSVKWTCPVCGMKETNCIYHIDPVYGKGIQGLEGIEKDRVLSPEEKAEMEAAMMVAE